MNRDIEQTSGRILAGRILATEAAEARTSEEWLQAAARIDAKLMTALAPVLGEVGVNALIARSLKKIKPRFPVIADLVTSAPPGELRAQLAVVLAGREPELASEICGSALAALFQLMSTFVGERVTRQLLKHTWPEIVIEVEPDPGETA